MKKDYIVVVTLLMILFSGDLIEAESSFSVSQEEAFNFGKGFTRGVGSQVGGNIDQIMQAMLSSYRTFFAIKSLDVIVGTLLKAAAPFIERRLGHMLGAPQLIIETSKKGIRERIKDYFTPTRQEEIELVFDVVVEKRLNDIVKAVQTINKRIFKEGKKNVTYRNLMLYGPPGTGKTAFARELAKRSGMEWAMMSGASFAKFQEGKGIEELDWLFKWANEGQGLLLFIDEAELFLRKRATMDTNSMDYKLISNFLSYTGAPSNKFMIVFATNHKHNLDPAMYERIHDFVHISLPTYNERVRILNVYKKKVLLNEKENGKPFVQSVHTYLPEKKIEEIAAKTEGFSGRGLQILINGIQANAIISDTGLVTLEAINAAFAQALEKYHELKE